MTETERKALALVNEVNGTDHRDLDATYIFQLRSALCRAIEQHDAFRQEVSGAVEEAMEPTCSQQVYDALKRFRITKPVDPLVEALLETFPRANGAEGMASDLRTALAARGLEIREMGQ